MWRESNRSQRDKGAATTYPVAPYGRDRLAHTVGHVRGFVFVVLGREIHWATTVVS